MSRHDLSHVIIHGDRKGFYVSPPVPPKPPTPPVPWPQGLLAPCAPAPFVALREEPHA